MYIHAGIKHRCTDEDYIGHTLHNLNIIHKYLHQGIATRLFGVKVVYIATGKNIINFFYLGKFTELLRINDHHKGALQSI